MRGNLESWGSSVKPARSGLRVPSYNRTPLGIRFFNQYDQALPFTHDPRILSMAASAAGKPTEET